LIDAWVMAPPSEPERRDFWEICEDRYQVPLRHPDFATAGLTLARKDWWSNAGRRISRSARPQRPSYRDAWRFNAQNRGKPNTYSAAPSTVQAREGCRV